MCRPSDIIDDIDYSSHREALEAMDIADMVEEEYELDKIITGDPNLPFHSPIWMDDLDD